VFDWGDDGPTTVEFLFTPLDGDATYVEVTESGLRGDGDALVARVADSTGGFTIVLCAAKALLEHDLVLAAVRDAHPHDLKPDS
jgi:predicted RNA-binding protein with TRAM domain